MFNFSKETLQELIDEMELEVQNYAHSLHKQEILRVLDSVHQLLSGVKSVAYSDVVRAMSTSFALARAKATMDVLNERQRDQMQQECDA